MPSCFLMWRYFLRCGISVSVQSNYSQKSTEITFSSIFKLSLPEVEPSRTNMWKSTLPIFIEVELTQWMHILRPKAVRDETWELRADTLQGVTVLNVSTVKRKKHISHTMKVLVGRQRTEQTKEHAAYFAISEKYKNSNQSKIPFHFKRFSESSHPFSEMPQRYIWQQEVATGGGTKQQIWPGFYGKQHTAKDRDRMCTV